MNGKKDVYKRQIVISPPEERLTEREMSERPPRILLTNVNQLEPVSYTHLDVYKRQFIARAVPRKGLA